MVTTILWADKATHKLNHIRVNWHNCVSWDSDNPHLVMQNKLNDSNVSAGIFFYALIGFDFFNSTINSENYLKILHEVMLKLEENSSLFGHLQPVWEKLIWQQNDAPPNFGLIVMDFLFE